MTQQILVVDDEESIRFTFEAFLGDSGYEVLTAESAAEANALMDQHRFDLIFLDIMLGRDSGISLLKEIRARFATCPVVMIMIACSVAMMMTR